MKKIFNIFIITIVVLSSCKKLDRFPLDKPNSVTFYSNKAEFDLALAGLYNTDIYPFDSEEWTDNMWQRAGTGNNMIHGTTTIQSAEYSAAWTMAYRGITRANTILENINRPTDVTPAYRTSAEAQARLVRGYDYGFLALHYGDVPLVKKSITVEESKVLTRAPKQEVVKYAYDEFDFAAANLPVTYASGNQYYTKGIALALKARLAIGLNDWATAAVAAKEVMGLNYSLYPSYRDLFLRAGQHSKEVIMSFPRSAALKVTYNIQYSISRNAGGFASDIPTLEMIDSYECTDGKTIDKSVLYNPKQPFLNRDPRLKASIVTPGENWLGFDYQNHPDITQVMNYGTGKMVNNQDAKNATYPFASFTGYLYKKGMDITQIPAYNLADFDKIIIRYAEILLIYAEAKIELNEIDASVLEAINLVRARAYGVDMTAIASYPAVVTLDQAELRKIVRRERRVELVTEGTRYMDLLRWKLAEKTMNTVVYGVPTNKADYPFVGTPTFDQDDIPSYAAFSSKLFVCDTRKFDKSKNYIWPVPYAETNLNKGLGQNDGWK